MIHVDRDRVPVPEVLRSPHAERERERIEKLLHSSPEHLAQLRITIDVQLCQQAKPALVELFQGKCAYCESALDEKSAEVEHFRPKQGATGLDGSKDQHHYAWLALAWENLLVACAECTRRRTTTEGTLVGKGTVFPVAAQRALLLAPLDECRRVEDALLIDPCVDRPEEHLAFDKDGGCRSLTSRGKITIELLDLDRGSLREARARVWSEVDFFTRALVAKYGAPDAKSTIDRLRDHLAGRRPHTAVARAAFTAVVDAADVRSSKGRILPDSLEALIEVVEQSRPPAKTAASPPQTQAAPPAFYEQTMNAPAFSPPAQFKGKTGLPRFVHQLVRRVEIHNFKIIEHLSLDLPDAPHAEGDLAAVTLLLGENASGKSTILEAIALTLLGTDLIDTLGLDARDFIRRTNWDAPLDDAAPAEVAVYFADTDEPVRLRIDPAAGRFEGPRDPSTIVLAYGPRRFFNEGRRRRQLPGLAEQVRTLFDPMAVIENPTRWLMDAPQDDFDAAVRALRQLLLLADEAIVARPPEGKRRGKQIMFEVQGDVAPLNRLSEGYKTIVATSVDMMRELLEYWPDLEDARGVVLIDELETHLHPRWKMRIVSRLRRALPNVQFIATTHDPLCLRGLYDGEAQVLQRDEAKRVETLVGLPNVRGLNVEQLLTSEFFGLFSTEDPRLEEEVARYAELATKRDRSADEEQALVAQRQNVQQMITVGVQPEDQLLHDATNEYLRQRREARPSERPALKRAAIERVVNLWKSLDAGGDGQ